MARKPVILRDRRVPESPAELSAGWLTGTLHDGGALFSASVSSFTTETIAEGVGLLGQLARLSIEYDRDEPGAPSSLIAKFPAAAPENRELANLFRFYEKEVRFYREVARSLPLGTPRCYFGSYDPERGSFVLLLEDLSSARRPVRGCLGDQLAGCGAAQVETAIRSLAGLHAAWWDTPALERLDWLPYANDPVHHSAEGSYQQAWGPFLQRFADRLSPELIKIGEKLATRVVKLLDRLTEPPRTFVHGDFRSDNLFFFDSPDQPLAVIDWQISSRGRGAYDLGYFLSQSVDTKARRDCEKRVLKAYHEALLKQGVEGYSLEQCWDDYRLSALYCFIYPEISGGTLDLSNERGLALVTAMLDRSAAAITDLDAGAMMPE